MATSGSAWRIGIEDGEESVRLSGLERGGVVSVRAVPFDHQKWWAIRSAHPRKLEGLRDRDIGDLRPDDGCHATGVTERESEFGREQTPTRVLVVAPSPCAGRSARLLR